MILFVILNDWQVEYRISYEVRDRYRISRNPTEQGVVMLVKSDVFGFLRLYYNLFIVIISYIFQYQASKL
jgi:hypothetical protein